MLNKSFTKIVCIICVDCIMYAWPVEKRNDNGDYIVSAEVLIEMSILNEILFFWMRASNVYRTWLTESRLENSGGVLRISGQ